ncbi:hypothetical protein vB_PsyM_KIL4_0146 [Pseudomonas phage vB_PsyM_KIL4]|uniref:Uncharacterized protein n=1 Tax=Pseudomonas phage vB_PsyM_KIL4 TaxID=1777069 RepID=A0A142IF65_9CAUD|nr:hypothetical protein FDI83_gp067 [Pseudomonas phage vB_PsyM_KIL4]AMR57870.1 hypothetical protein vB_PsyM_KIL4_0146 [Pseudomonas phage vB_PsyM_KIL4]
MLLIGSRALIRNNPELESQRKCVDWDFICTLDQFRQWHRHHKGRLQFAVPTQGGKYYHARDKDGMNYEFELAWEGTSAAMLLQQYGIVGIYDEPVTAINDDLYLIKMSHRYKRNSPHFLKTMSDIKFLREKEGQWELDRWMGNVVNVPILKAREAESYTYAHPKLNVSSKDFFNGDGVNYIYDHDEIHKIVAVESTPAYTKYMQEGEQVMTSKEKFFAVDQRTRLLGGLEESMVLALERSQVPHGLGKEGGPTDRWSFEMALMKVCSSITSGYFREFCWEHHSEIMAMYDEMGESWYTNKFKEAVANGEILPRDL